MTTLSRSQAATILQNLGWRVNTDARYLQAVKDFQTGWNLGAWLTIDGKVGPNTSAALLKSEARRRLGQTTCSAHFSFSEFRCKCGGAYSTCRRIWINRNQVHRLEQARAKLGRPIAVISGCRCYYWNQSVGGVSGSQHLKGTATDWIGPDKDTFKSWKLAAGIGYSASTDRVAHSDSRDKAGSTNTVSNPAVWRYTW